MKELVQQALDFRKEFIAQNPQLVNDVNDYFQLMKDEIQDGGSIQNEVNHFINACKDLLIEED